MKALLALLGIGGLAGLVYFFVHKGKKEKVDKIAEAIKDNSHKPVDTVDLKKHLHGLGHGALKDAFNRLFHRKKVKKTEEAEKTLNTMSMLSGGGPIFGDTTFAKGEGV